MSKSHSRESLTSVFELDKKQKIMIYPYYPLTETYQTEDGWFIFTVQYFNSVASLTSVLSKQGCAKKSVSNSIDLIGINDRSGISTIQILDLSYKELTTSVWIEEALILVGYREGQLAIVQAKGKKSSVVCKLNRHFKKESVFMRASNYFSGEESYKVMIPGPIKAAEYRPSKKFLITYLVGNSLVFLKSKDDLIQQTLEKLLHEAQWITNVRQQKVIQSELMALTEGKVEISDYNYTKKEEIFISLSMESVVKCFSITNLENLFSIYSEMPIRKIAHFSCLQGDFLTVMPYEDYLLVIDLGRKKYTKQTGLRSFAANTSIIKSQLGKSVLVCAGMDHRICFDQIDDLKGWVKCQAIDCDIKVNQQIKGVPFGSRYSLGEYENARTNNHDYGFSEIMTAGRLLILPTYDSKIKVLSLHYK